MVPSKIKYNLRYPEKVSPCFVNTLLAFYVQHTYFTFAILPCSKYTSKIETSAGFTPDILEA